MKFLKLVFLIGLLALVRAFENQLFYDPFLSYFKSDYSQLPLPEYNSALLFLGILFRYTLNTVLSLGVIYVFFEEMEMIRFVSVLYFFLFLILIGIFFMAIHFYGETNKLMLFYIRRFLIQPVFLLLFIPGFYCQKRVS